MCEALGYDLKATVEEADTEQVKGHSRKRNRMCKGPDETPVKESGPLCLLWTVQGRTISKTRLVNINGEPTCNRKHDPELRDQLSAGYSSWAHCLFL